MPSVARIGDPTSAATCPADHADPGHVVLLRAGAPRAAGAA